MAKDYGAGVSGYLEPDGRNWETTVYQAAKPVLDKELNLAQDAAALARPPATPSGWLAEDLIKGSAPTPFFISSTTSNQFTFSSLRALVNGWTILVENTLRSGANQTLDLGASPSGAGAKRTDLVILEVWRRLLSASPSTDGKSHTARIWANGNVKVSSADDAAINYTDDILDSAVGSETTKRVQIQYRLRVIQDVDLSADPYGMTDANVVANAVPTAPASPDGAATTWTYSNMSSTLSDPGLWRAGDGNPANTLGTVDGYMYAIPLVAVERRNDTAFDRNTNHNGGVAYPASSDRPDGFWYDIITNQDLLDLRMGVSPSGWDFQEVLARNLGWLLDNDLQQERLLTTHGGGVLGHTVLWADEVGVLPGDGTTTGDTPGATFLGQFDAVRRRYSDRPIIETLILRYEPTDGSGGGPNWQTNDTITIDFTALKLYPYHASSYNFAARAPAEFTVLGFDDYLGGGGNYGATYFIGSSAGEEGQPARCKLSGLGAMPQGSLTLDIGTVPGGVTDEPLYIRLAIAYPPGEGLSKTPVEDFGTDSFSINNPAQLPATAPILFSQMYASSELDIPHREVPLIYETVSFVQTFIHTNAIATLFLPERMDSISQIKINTVTYGGSFSLYASGYEVYIANPLAISQGDLIEVTGVALRPLPQNGEQLTIYYNARGAQTVPEGFLPSPLKVIPRYISSSLYSMTVGSGSPEEAYPYGSQYVQSGGIYPTSGGTFSGDHELDASSAISIEGFSSDTGFLQIPCHVPYVPEPDEAWYYRSPGDVDAEGRSFYKTVLTTTYRPNAFGSVLSEPKRHKVLLPIVAELVEDTSFGFQGQLVLVTLQRWASFDDVNGIYFDQSLGDNTTTASVYRIKGNLLSNRSV
jgi:hypothetical protein